MNLMVKSILRLIVGLTLILPVSVAAPPAADQELAPDVLAAYVKQLTVGSATERKETTVALKQRDGHALAVAPLLVERLATAYEGRHAGSPGSVADFAERALELFGKSAVPALIKGLKHSDIAVRHRSAVLLGLVKDDSSIVPLISALGDRETTVASSASVALGQVGNPAVASLLAVVNRRGSEDSSEVCPWSEVSESERSRCRYGIDALGLINDVNSIDTLIVAGIEDSFPGVRC